MPYTPPSQRSPATSKPSSPIISRNHSYNGEPKMSAPMNHSHPRPALPRSVSSASYLNMQRRSPSMPHSRASSEASKSGSTNGSLRQSPSPVNDLLIPSGAITTPPDSAQGSDDDDERTRQVGNLAELQEALSAIEVMRKPSPTREGDSVLPHSSSSPPRSVRPSLTPEARRISHSRSSSEIQLPRNTSAIDENSETASDSDDDDGLRMKPPLLRKKSGELVKPALRPSSRRRPSSMPGTPTFSKAVHFDEEIEHVRHFLQVDKPSAVSAGTSPVESYESESEYPFALGGASPSKTTEWELRLANFPRETFERKVQPCRVERIFLSADMKTLIGTVAVANLSFNKSVVARFTLDYWKTTSEVVAEYNNDVRKKQSNDGYDRFNFNIKLSDQANLETKTLLLCVRYNVNGEEYWDNNNAMNYQVDFIKKVKAKAPRGGLAGPRAVPIPRSRHSPPASRGRPRSFPAADDDFSAAFDAKYQFGAVGPKIQLSESPNQSIRLKPKTPRGSIVSDEMARRSASGGGQAFSTRYDFGASLTAALSNAQNALGDRSGLKPRVIIPESKGAPVAPPTSMAPRSAAAAPTTGVRPGNLSSEKPALQSAEYNELIQKFCFFGSGSASSPMAVPTKPKAISVRPDGGEDSDATIESNPNSGASTPPTPTKEMAAFADGSLDRSNTRSPTHFLSRSNSPGPLTGSDLGDKTQGPMNFGFPYNHNGRSGFLSEPHTPQPIAG